MSIVRTASVLYPAGWLAWVFSKAQQQVQNRPAMLQNTLSTDNTVGLQQVFAAGGNYSTSVLNFKKNMIDLYDRPVSEASCVAQRTELHPILSFVLTLQQNRSLSTAGHWKSELILYSTQPVKTALLDSKSPFINFKQQSQSVLRKATVLLNK